MLSSPSQPVGELAAWSSGRQRRKETFLVCGTMPAGEDLGKVKTSRPGCSILLGRCDQTR